MGNLPSSAGRIYSFFKQDTGRGEREIADCASDINDISILQFNPLSSLCQLFYTIILIMQKVPHYELKVSGWVSLGPK